MAAISLISSDEDEDIFKNDAAFFKEMSRSIRSSAVISRPTAALGSALEAETLENVRPHAIIANRKIGNNSVRSDNVVSLVSDSEDDILPEKDTCQPLLNNLEHFGRCDDEGNEASENVMHNYSNRVDDFSQNVVTKPGYTKRRNNLDLANLADHEKASSKTKKRSKRTKKVSSEEMLLQMVSGSIVALPCAPQPLTESDTDHLENHHVFTNDKESLVDDSNSIVYKPSSVMDEPLLRSEISPSNRNTNATRGYVSDSINNDSKKKKRSKQKKKVTGEEMLQQINSEEMVALPDERRPIANIAPSRQRQARSGVKSGPKFAYLEIAVSLDTKFRKSAAAIEIIDVLGHASYNDVETPYHITTSFSSSLSGVIKWQWRSNEYGGAMTFDDVSENEVALQNIPFIAMYWNNVDFIRCSLQEEYTTFSDTIKTLRKCIDSENARVLFIVEGLHKGIVSISKRRKNGAATRQDVLDRVYKFVAHLYIQHSCSVKFTIDVEDSANYIEALTRQLSLVPYQEETTALDFVARTTSFYVRPDGSTSIPSTSWLKMLQLIEGVSERKAQSIVSNFPCIKSLMDKYQSYSLDENQKNGILQNCMGTTRSENVISTRIRMALSSTDPSAILI